jgi:hypothetical protein
MDFFEELFVLGEQVLLVAKAPFSFLGGVCISFD